MLRMEVAKDSMESLYLKWKDYAGENCYCLGALIKEKDKYFFKIDKTEYEKAKEMGFNPASLPFLPNKIYESIDLFEFFKMRIPEEEYDELYEFEYLRESKGRIATDNFILDERKN